MAIAKVSQNNQLSKFSYGKIVSIRLVCFTKAKKRRGCVEIPLPVILFVILNEVKNLLAQSECIQIGFPLRAAERCFFTTLRMTIR